MKVILAEKPSVAREIAGFLGAQTRHDGYFEGQGYQVTWAYGHLVTLKEPDEYDPLWKKWSLATLPILPARFELKRVDSRHARQQFAIVKQLFHAADELICATDAGREGELIFRYILSLSGCEQKSFHRLWLSSLTRRAIGEAFKRLRPGHDYDNLYAAARCRSEADWIVGMNGTRNYTTRFGTQGLLWSVGRVQTPVLAMIVRRDDAIRTFQSEPFWELLTRYRKTLFKFTGDRFAEQAAAQELLDRVVGQTFTIRKVERRLERSQPPQLYDLTELQRDMNRRFGLSAAVTLQAAQSLYEAKRITYPRTDSRYVGKDLKLELPKILENLRQLRPEAIERLDLGSLRFTGRIVNDHKVGDHHAILPTGKLPGSLSGPQAKVFDAIVTRLIAVFYPPCVKEVTTAHGQAAEVPFQAKGYRTLDPGWTALYPRKAKDPPEGNGGQELPNFQAGEHGPHVPVIQRGETSAPVSYTENTLLGAMETAGRMVDDEQLREALKEKGLGTPATRAAIIETLLKRNYIRREKKKLTATELGRYLIAVVQDQDLKSPELSGRWEAKLRQIEAGRLAPQKFMDEIVEYTRRIVEDSDTDAVDATRLGECPRCGRPVIQGKRGFGCSGWREGCSFVIWPSWQDQELSLEQIRCLLQRRVLLHPRPSKVDVESILALTDSGQLTEITLPQGEKQGHGRKKTTPRSGASGKPPRNAATGKATKTGKATRSPTPRLGKCPRCGADVVDQAKSFSCSGWRQGCPFAIWKKMAGKRISARTTRSLLKDGKTSLLKGFKSKAGKPFEARLKIVDGEIKFDFDA